MCFMTIAVNAQVTTNTSILRQASLDFRTHENDNYAKALLLAKQKGWPLVIKGHNNQIATLIGVDAFGFPKYYTLHNNTIAAATTRANQLWPGGSSGLNLSGSSANMNSKLGEWDAGTPLSTHVELTGRINYKDGATNPTPVDHSTHVAGTMIATGVNPIAKGMAFGAQNLIAYDYNNDISEMFSQANNLLLSKPLVRNTGRLELQQHPEPLGMVRQNPAMHRGLQSSVITAWTRKASTRWPITHPTTLL